MNNNLRKLLTAAACIAFFTNTSENVFADTVTISDRATASGTTKTLRVYSSGVGSSTYTWDADSEDSIDAKLISDTLTINGYNTTDSKNGTLNATGGVITVGSGALTIDSSSSISQNVNVNLSTGSTLNITGGSVALNENFSGYGDIDISSGAVSFKNTTKNGTFTQTDGTTTIAGSGFNINAGDSVTGGTLNIGDGTTTTTNINGTISSAAGVNINNNATANISGGSVTLDSSDSWNGKVNVSSGSLALVGINKNSTGELNQTGGNIKVEGSEGFYLNNTNDSISGGTLDIGTDTTEGNLYVTQGTISQGAQVNIATEGMLEVRGGNVTLDSNDTFNGIVGVTGGNLTLSNVNKNSEAIFIQNSGTTNVTGDLALNNSFDSVEGGTMNIGSDSTSGSVTVNKGTITNDAQINITSNGSLNVQAGEVSLGSDDTWDGNITYNGGTLALNNITKNGSYTHHDGTLNVSGQKFDLNNTNDLIDGGTINIGDGSTIAKLNVSKGTITEDATVNINEKGTLNISGGNVTLDKNDTWTGDVNISDGSLALVGIKKEGAFTQTGGSTTVTGKNFALDSEYDYVSGGDLTIGNGFTQSELVVSQGAISKDAVVNIKNNSTLNIQGGNVEYGENGNWEGNINISSGNLTFYDTTKQQTGTFTQTGGKTTVIGDGLDLNNSDDIISGGTLNIGNKTTVSNLEVSQGYIASDAVVNVNRNGTLNITGGDAELDSDDTWYGDIKISDGTLEIDDITKKSTGTFTQTGGKTTISGDFELNNANDNITGGTLNLTSSNLEVSKGTIGQGAKVNLDSSSDINISGGLVALDNTDQWDGDISVNGGSLALIGINNKNGTYTQTKGTTTVTESGFDMNNAADKITGGNLNIGDGTTISDMSVSQGTIGPNTNVNIANNGTLKVTGGTVNLNTNTTYNGSIDMASGSLNMESVTKNPNGTFAQNGGTTTVNGTGFDLNNVSDSVANGTFNIGNGTTLTQVGISQGTIKSDAVTNINTNATLNIAGGGVSLNENDNWNGRINISSGKLNLMDARKNSDGALIQTGGVTTVTGDSFELNNTYDKISGGTLNIGTEQEPSTMSSSRGTIEAGAEVNLAHNSTLNISGSDITINDNDNWNGNINLTNGNLYLSGTEKNSSGTLTQSGGKTTITNTNTLNNEDDNISGGNLIIGTLSSAGILNVENGTITSGASVTVNAAGTLNQKGGETTIDGANDTWNGNVTISDGTLNLNNKLNKTTTSTSTFNQTGGEVNIDDAKLTLNTADSKITGGTVNLTGSAALTVNNQSQNSSALTSTGGKLTIGKLARYALTGGNIDTNSAVTVEKSATLALEGAETEVTLDGSNDSVKGSLELQNGTLNLNNNFNKTTTSDGTYKQTGGTLNISQSKLALNENDSIISGGEVNISGNSELIINNNNVNTSALNSTDSKLTINNNSSYTVTDGTIDGDSKVTIEANAALISNGKDTEITLDGKDITAGTVNLKDGTLYITDDLTKVTDANGHYIQSGGSMTMSDSQLTLADEKSIISGGDVNLTNNSTLTVNNSGSAITGGNIVIDDTSVLNYLAEKGLVQISDGEGISINTSGLINMANGVITNSNINNLTINNSDGDAQADFTIDLHARSSNNSSTDTITADSIRVAQAGSNGTIRISDWNLGGDIYGYDAPIEKSIRLGKIFNSDDIGSEIQFAATDKEIFTPIGYYRLNASGANDGNYTLDLTRFNPQVFRGQVATISSYMNQLVVNDTLFNRANIRRYHSSYEEKFKNKTAILDANASYERTLKDGNLWTEAFGNFETLKMSHGLNKVRNNSWGFIVGGDFGLKELRNGWKWMPTAYIAYNGAHQTFNKVGMYENGGQIGFMSSFTKDNFMDTALVYGGLYGTTMDVAGTSEDAFNWFLGLANRTSYDFLPWGPNFKIQPSLTLAYNLFGEQNWHSDYGQMGMSSGFLNGFNIAPGVNFIWQKENWNMYATIAYTWNLFGDVDGRAGNVGLPDVEMKHGYLTWGFGMSKSFSERLNMYAQATVRNIGRTGIICQGGLNYRL